MLLLQVLMLALLLSGHCRSCSAAIVYLLPVEKVDRMRHFENGAAERQIWLCSARFSSPARELELPLVPIDVTSSPVWNVARHLVGCITKSVGSTCHFAKEHIGRASSARSSCSAGRTSTGTAGTGSTA